MWQDGRPLQASGFRLLRLVYALAHAMSAKRPCLDCKKPTAGTRCPDCTREKDQARGTRQKRGYDAAHEAERARWAPIVATGGVRCWRCLVPLDPDLPWDLGHDDRDRSIYRGPECRRCNRATSGRIS